MSNVTVPIELIVIGDNPRTFFDDARQKELVASIKAVGLIVPLTVGPADELGSYPLIAGERRLRALQELGITETPIYISTSEHAAGARVIENVVRADLHPIEEGRAYLALMTSGPKVKSATALAKELGISKSRISARTKLAVLPTEIADILIAGSVLNALMDDLVAFTEAFGGEVMSRFVETSLEALTKLATPDPNADRYDDGGDMHDVFEDFLEHAPDVDIVHLTGHSVNVIEACAPSAEAYEAFKQTMQASLGKHAYMRIDDDDLDAMRAFNALREFKINDWQDEQYCTSKVWLWDRLNAQLTEAVKAAEETGKGLPTNGRGDPIKGKPLDPVKKAKAEDREPTAEEVAASEKLKEEAKAERDRVKAQREEAGRRNQALALGAAKAFDQHKLRVSDAKLLVQIIVTGNGLVHGWELCQGKELEGKDAGLKARNLRDWICRGKGVEGIIGRLFQVIACGAYADNDALPQSKRKSLAFDLMNDKPELLAVARLAMPEDRYKVMAEAIAERARQRELDERIWNWRSERTAIGVLYNDYQGLAPSHAHPFDPTSEVPVYIQELNFTTVPPDVFEMVALNVTVAGQILKMPDGYSYDGAGSVREVGGDIQPFREWVGEPFNRRLPKHPSVTEAVTEGSDTAPADVEEAPEQPAPPKRTRKQQAADKAEAAEMEAAHNGDGPHDPEADAINAELDARAADEFANAIEGDD